MVGAVVAVEVAVHSVLKVAVVNPHVAAVGKVKVVVAVDVKGARTLERYVAYYYVLAVLERQYAALLDVGRVDAVYQGRARQSVDGLVLHVLHAYKACYVNLSLNVDSVLVGAYERRFQLAHGGHLDGALVVSARYGAADSAPAHRTVVVVGRHLCLCGRANGEQHECAQR